MSDLERCPTARSTARGRWLDRFGHSPARGICHFSTPFAILLDLREALAGVQGDGVGCVCVCSHWSVPREQNPRNANSNLTAERSRLLAGASLTQDWSAQASEFANRGSCLRRAGMEVGSLSQSLRSQSEASAPSCWFWQFLCFQLFFSPTVHQESHTAPSFTTLRALGCRGRDHVSCAA